MGSAVLAIVGLFLLHFAEFFFRESVIQFFLLFLMLLQGLFQRGAVKHIQRQ